MEEPAKRQREMAGELIFGPKITTQPGSKINPSHTEKQAE
jgi:hypothetical protein